MKTILVLLAQLAMVAAPSFAGDLEDGAKFHERKQYAKALFVYQKAALAGNAEALRRMGFMYYQGEGVAMDLGRAVALFEQSADAGDSESAHNLGKMYQYGLSVTQNDQRAAAWYRKGADYGNPYSQFELGILYYQGLGVAQDRIEAAKWFAVSRKTVQADSPWAANLRRTITSVEGKLSADENAEAKRRADEWLTAHGSRR